jgi:hypothetical protein
LVRNGRRADDYAGGPREADLAVLNNFQLTPKTNADALLWEYGSGGIQLVDSGSVIAAGASVRLNSAWRRLVRACSSVEYAHCDRGVKVAGECCNSSKFHPHRVVVKTSTPPTSMSVVQPGERIWVPRGAFPDDLRVVRMNLPQEREILWLDAKPGECSDRYQASPLSDLQL